MSIQLNQHQSVLIFSILIGTFINWIAFRFGFFKKTEHHKSSIHLIDVIGMFSVFLIMQVLVAPLIAFVYYSIHAGRLITSELAPYITSYAQGWFNILSILAGGIGVIFGLSCLKQVKREQIWGQTSWKNLCFGVLAWLISFPLAVAAGELAWFGVYYLFGLDVHLEQIAVKHLNEVSSYPFLFSVTIAAVVFLAPLVEEILFRGFLQSWLVEKVGILGGIVITSLIFSLFHFACSQGMANIVLMASLFVLSCFLGFVYIRQNSLLASIGLHLTFNFISVIMLILK